MQSGGMAFDCPTRATLPPRGARVESAGSHSRAVLAFSDTQGQGCICDPPLTHLFLF